MNLDAQIKAAALEAITDALNTGKVKINFPAQAVRSLIKEETPAIAEKTAKDAAQAVCLQRNKDLAASLDALAASVAQSLAAEAKARQALSDSLTQATLNMPAASSAPKEIHVYTSPDKEPKKLTGLFHKQFSDVCRRVQLNAAHKRGLWLWGAAGGGKTTLAQQLADALDVKFVPIFGSPTLTDTKLLGYNNASNGQFVPGSVYDAYACPEAQERGALLFIDEADAGEFLLVLNALLANDYYRFANGEVLKRPSKFYILAAANTLGNGSQGGYRRAVIDRASQDRFTPYRLDYDEQLEAGIAGAPEVSKWVFQARKWIESHVQGGILTPRTHFAIADYWRAGIETAAEEALSSGLSPDNWKALRSALPAFPACPKQDKPTKKAAAV